MVPHFMLYYIVQRIESTDKKMYFNFSIILIQRYDLFNYTSLFISVPVCFYKLFIILRSITKVYCDIVLQIIHNLNILRPFNAF